MASIGENRMNAGARLLALILYGFAWIAIGWLAVLIVLLVALIDIVWQGVTNGEGLTEMNPVAHFWSLNKQLVGWMLWDKQDRPTLADAKPSGSWTRR